MLQNVSFISLVEHLYRIHIQEMLNRVDFAVYLIAAAENASFLRKIVWPTNNLIKMRFTYLLLLLCIT